MATISYGYKPSKNTLSFNTCSVDGDFIKTYDDANSKFKPGDVIYSELNYTMSFVLKIKKVVNYAKGLAFQYDFMLNRFDNIYKDSWCYSDCCRFATEEEIKLLQKKMKSYKKKL